MALIDRFILISWLKKERQLSNRLSLSISVSLSICVFVILLPLVRLDYDAHHDGVMLASAIANHGGHAVHSGAFAQYGPTTVWIHSFSLIFSFPPALTLRVVTALMIAMTVFFVADLGRYSRRTLGLTSPVTIFASIAWFIIFDAFNWVQMLPWSSTFAQLQIVIGLYLVFGENRTSLNNRWSSFRSGAFCGGVIWSLLPFTRINIGLVLIPALLLILIFSEVKSSDARRTLRSIMLGVSLGLISLVLILMFTNSLSQWWEQAIVWPARWNASLNSGTGMFLKLKFMYSNMANQIVSLAALLTVLFLLQKLRSRWTFLLQLFVVSISSALAIKHFSSASPQIWSASTIPQTFQGMTNLRIGLLGFLFWSGLTLSVLSSLLVLLRSMGKQSYNDGSMLLLFFAVSISGTVQIVPVSDSRHFWWGMPLIIVVLFRQVSKLLNHSSLLSFVLFTPLILASIFAVSLTRENLAQPRQAGPIGSVAEGMMFNSNLRDGVSKSKQYLENYQALSRWVGSDQSFIFLVRDGDLSVFDGEFHSIDESFVIWGPVKRFGSRVANAKGVVLDVDFVSAFQPELFDLGFSQVAKTNTISIWKR